MKKDCQKECQKAYNIYINSFIDADNGNITKRLWSFIKHIKKHQCSIPQYMLLIPSLQIAKNNLMHSMITLHQPSPKNLSTLPTISSIHFLIYHLFQFLWRKLLIYYANHHKATGPDYIPAYFLKELSNKLAQILTLIFQSSLHQGLLSEEWKIANIIPIFKNGSPFQTYNHCPVSLTSICSKILEHTVYCCIFSHLCN